jgi:hypothetical protein
LAACQLASRKDYSNRYADIAGTKPSSPWRWMSAHIPRIYLHLPTQGRRPIKSFLIGNLNLKRMLSPMPSERDNFVTHIAIGLDRALDNMQYNVASLVLQDLGFCRYGLFSSVIPPTCSQSIPPSHMVILWVHRSVTKGVSISRKRMSSAYGLCGGPP